MSYQLVSVVMLVLVVQECINAFMLEYTDCVAPEQIRRVDVAKVCQSSPLSANSNKRMMLTQIKSITRMTGYKCKIKESRFRYYCGAFSHLKVAKVPTISHDLPVSTDWCRTLSSHRQFQPPGSSQLLDIAIDQTTFVQVASSGELLVRDDKVGCKGETVHTGNGLVDNILELV